MYPVSDAFVAAITGDHEWTTRVHSSRGPGDEPVDVSAYFEGGSLTVARQQIRRSGTVTFVDSDGTLVPRLASDPLAPYGQELLIDCGLVYPDGTEELIPQGVFRLTRVATRYPRITCQLFDRSWIVSGNKPLTPKVIASGTLYTTAIQDMVSTAYPSVLFEATAAAHTTPTIVLDALFDPWSEAQKMAEAIGYELYFDRLGVCHLEPETDAAMAEPVLVYSDASTEFIPRGDEHWRNLATYDQELDWDTDDVINAVLARGENSGNGVPAQGVAYDTDPASPTRYNGPFGARTGELVSPLFTSDSMAYVGARAHLVKVAGISEGLTIPAIPHPALDVNDPIQVVRSALGINQVHVVDGFDVPLRAAATHTVQTRRRRVVLENA